MIRVVVIDDESHSQEALIDLFTDHKNVEIVGRFTNPIVALERCANLEFNAVFLDVEMPLMTGLDVASRLLVLNPILDIIFVSAYHEYIGQTVDLNPVDYLLKPVSQKQMDIVIKKLCVKRGKLQ